MSNYAYCEKGGLILGSRKLSEEIVMACETCKRNRGKLHTLKMGQLPGQRALVREMPFAAVGVDLVGKIKIKQDDKITNGVMVIITCLTTRACHL